MTVILVLLCLAIAGRELYLAFERKRIPAAPEIADIRTQLRALRGTRDELESVRRSQAERLDRLTQEQDRDREALGEADARIRSLITQINDRMVPDVNDKLHRQREAAERLAADVAGLRTHLARRLDQAVAASLGADPVDIVAGTLRVEPPEARPPVAGAYERFAEHHGLRVELTDLDRYYLSGRSPRGLERDFIELVRVSRDGTKDTEPLQDLERALRDAEWGTAQIGPLLLVRTPESTAYGVLPLADLLRPETAALLDNPPAALRRLHLLPETRFHTLTGSETST
ncbi:hypothetical protein BZB76_0540 [Actinomadura pelletieri DSM 43383]|uniref:Uncharacterized protein n=1 Tax=Actinomadura pelletieri DSM 43383 TaxID=1120940 RepID=A0A495QY13_9ACTN|nr:hypothetical protein [Actinomadura pelletieri]RKS79099.1 hypothetical protein BZB76_0540 [Actinomadura pelletieri DSM 43383]